MLLRNIGGKASFLHHVLKPTTRFSSSYYKSSDDSKLKIISCSSFRLGAFINLSHREKIKSIVCPRFRFYHPVISTKQLSDSVTSKFNLPSPLNFHSFHLDILPFALQKPEFQKDCSLLISEDFSVTSFTSRNLLQKIAFTKELEKQKRNVIQEFYNTPIYRRKWSKVFRGNFIAFKKFEAFRLGEDAERALNKPNAGGGSSTSESLSVEFFGRNYQAHTILTEMEVAYCIQSWKKVDYICTLYDERVGVSVTRAMSFPNSNDFSIDSAYTLLFKKIFGLVVARHGVKSNHNFTRCILHIWCETNAAANLLELIFPHVLEKLALIDNVIMVLTVAEGKNGHPIFYGNSWKSL